jgi:hypothetical protein
MPTLLFLIRECFMIAVNSITNRLYTLLSADPVLAASAFHVQNGAAINADPEYAPWIGILRGALTLEPYVIGALAPWRGTLDVLVFHQEFSLLSDPDVLRRVDVSADHLTTLVASNVQLDGLVQKLDRITTELWAFNRMAEANFVTHLITLRYAVAG